MWNRRAACYEFREGAVRYRKRVGGSSAKQAREGKRTDNGYAYTAVFEAAEEGGYVVRFPAFGYLATQGDTLAEARAMAIDCLEGRIAAMLAVAENLPPSDIGRAKPRIEIVRIKPRAV